MTQLIPDAKQQVKEKKVFKKKIKSLNLDFFLNSKKSKKSSTKKVISVLKKAKKQFRYLTRYKFYNHNLRILGLMLNPSFNVEKALITIRVESNNIFCSLVIQKKIIKSASSGTYRVSVSLKKQRFASRQILETFFYKIKKHLSLNDILINIIAPVKIRRLLIKLLPKFKYILFKNKDLRFLTINVQAKKAFNGCRNKKKVRKKRRRRLVAR